MNEKRFDIIYDCQGVTRLIDRENKLISLDFGFDWNDLDNYEKDKVREWLDVLNEQQATISQLEEEKGYWKSKAMTLLMQVRRLTPRMTEKEVIEFSKELEDE